LGGKLALITIQFIWIKLLDLVNRRPSYTNVSNSLKSPLVDTFSSPLLPSTSYLQKSEEKVAAEEAAMWGRPQDGVPKEERSGTNAAVYWVATRLGGELTRLPDVTPLQIRTARSIKKFLTGDLKVTPQKFRAAEFSIVGAQG
jgi:hypothetical protein